MVITNIFVLSKESYELYKCGTERVLTMIRNGDSGLDIPLPRDYMVKARSYSNLIKLDIKIVMVNDDGTTIPFTLHLRSSTGLKTPIRLSNQIGIIDRNYRGELGAIVDNVSDEDFEMKRGNFYFQVCLPTLGRIENVYTLDHDSIEVDYPINRGGGFGSTGE